MIVSATKYAELRGRTKGWVSGRIDAGMPASGAGRSGAQYQIDTALAFQWEIEQEREKAEAKPGSQRDRLAKAQAEKFELENSRRRGELTLVSYIAELLNSMAADLGSRLDGLAGRLANELAGITDPAVIRERILIECRAIRSGIAEHVGKLAEHPPVTEDSGTDLDAAAVKKPKRVGRPKKNPASRKRRARAVEK